MDTEREFSWDDIIENDSQGAIVAPEGDYDFEIVNFERARYNGGSKLPPYNKAIVHVAIESAEGTTIIKHNLYLHSRCEGLLCSFFSAIGQRRHGEPLQMNWSKVVGARGRCKVGIRTYVNDRGEQTPINEVKRFYEPADAPNETPPGETPSGDGPSFTPGKF